MSWEPMEQSAGVKAFDVAGNLCGLAKWLRILGYDAECPRSKPSPGRTFISTRRKLPHPDTLEISSGKPMEQLKQVLEQTGVRPNPELFLSRCVVCNVLVEPVSLDRVAGKVPDAVLEMTATFNQCPSCGRIYWEGCHPERMIKRLETIGVHLE